MKNLAPVTEDKDLVTKEYLEANAGSGNNSIDGGNPESIYTADQIIDGGDVNGD
jgi:hypothetical protein